MCVRLTVRARGDVIAWEVDEWSVLVALATLTAGPESLPEFFAALRRYLPDHCWEAAAEAAEIEDAVGECESSCLIDLDSRSVFAFGSCELPDRRDAYQADEDDLPDGFPVVWLDTPDDWLFAEAGADWLSQVETRARALAARPQTDTRAVLFGEPLLAFLVDHVLEVAADVDAETSVREIRAIHAAWLLTPREDLQGRAPREVLLRNRSQVEMDIQHRSQQWSMQGFAPPALSKASAAYRFGGYGTTEIVIYFDLVRSLLGSVWEWTLADRPSRQQLVERLAEHREQLLDEPPEGDGSEHTCRELIESERRRMPVAVDGSHLDCDCPICQAEADGAFGSGPMFACFDGHRLELEDEFAFSLTESRDEWEKDQSEHQRFSEEMARKAAERAESTEEYPPVWRSSFVDWDSFVGSGDPPVPSPLAIGFLLAELVTALQERAGGQPHVDALNAAYTWFRRADNLELGEAANDLRRCLENVAIAFPDRTPQSADLQSRIDEVLRALAASSDSQSDEP